MGDVLIPIRKDNSMLSEQTFQVTVTLQSGSSATANQDFTFSSMTYTFLPSNQQMNVSLTILNDNMPEGMESFVLSVSLGGFLSIPQFPTTEVFITDDDGKFYFPFDTIFELTQFILTLLAKHY